MAEVRFNTESFLEATTRCTDCHDAQTATGILARTHAEDLQKTCEDRLPQMSSQEHLH